MKVKEECKSQLASIHSRLETEEITSNLLKEENAIFQRYITALRREEEWWRLKSRNLWLNSRDRNTKFFHRQDKVRVLHNSVKEITLEDGQTFNQFEEI